MNLLLNTHAFLWFIASDPRLSNQAQSLIQTPTNRRLTLRQFAPLLRRNRLHQRLVVQDRQRAIHLRILRQP